MLCSHFYEVCAQAKVGRCTKQKDGFSAFVPFSVPPLGEGLSISPAIYKKHEEAIRFVGKLDGITLFLPDSNFFLYTLLCNK